ncbi:MAG: ABC transporter permease, partial [Streptococcus parasanguinis]|nr:ABC transporter permease [Streptococcus parasanguinis]
MSKLLTTFQDRFGEWLTALGQHLQLSLLTLLVAIFLTIPLAVYLNSHKKVANWVLQVAGIFQTIPSMALLGLFIPFMGIGTLPALTALVIYAIFPILENTITALNGIDPSLEEAGIAFGMTKWERLKKFEIPLAMPVIVSGVRTATVMIIGTATLAALVGAGGLGSFILLGIDRRNASLILIGAISSAILAILFNVILKWLEKAKLRTIVAAFAVMLLGLGASYAPSMIPQKEKENL